MIEAHPKKLGGHDRVIKPVLVEVANYVAVQQTTGNLVSDWKITVSIHSFQTHERL
jgi:hypothetical protein